MTAEIAVSEVREQYLEPLGLFVVAGEVSRLTAVVRALPAVGIVRTKAISLRRTITIEVLVVPIVTMATVWSA